MKKYAIILLVFSPLWLGFGGVHFSDPLSKNEILEIIHISNRQSDRDVFKSVKPKRSPALSKYSKIIGTGKIQKYFFKISPVLYRKIICIYLI